MVLESEGITTNSLPWQRAALAGDLLCSTEKLGFDGMVHMNFGPLFSVSPSHQPE
jgi:hypothetical protein